MTKRDYIQSLENSDLLTAGVQLGVISATCFMQKEMYDYWFNLCAKGLNSTQAVHSTKDVFNVSKNTVWNAIQSMRENWIDRTKKQTGLPQ